MRVKIHHTLFPQESSTPCATNYGGWCHTDVWGPAQMPSIGGALYFSSYLDEATMELATKFQKTKAETLTSYHTHEKWVEVHRGPHISVLRSDHGGEYTSKEFNGHLASRRTHHELTVHDSPQQNRCAERLNGTLIGRAVAMLLDAGLPKYLWA